MVSSTVLATIRILIHTDFHVEAFLQGLGFLGLCGEEGGIVGPVTSDGSEAFARVLVTGFGLNNLTLFYLVPSRITENGPVAFHFGS